MYREGKPYLVAANPNYPAIEVREGDELIIWGVATKNITPVMRLIVNPSMPRGNN